MLVDVGRLAVTLGQEIKNSTKTSQKQKTVKADLKIVL